MNEQTLLDPELIEDTLFGEDYSVGLEPMLDACGCSCGCTGDTAKASSLSGVYYGNTGHNPPA